MKNDKFRTKGFKFKQFSIEGGESGMPVSTDGVMLGAWIESPVDATILDIGTGTGLLALMCAQRFSLAQMTAVDIEVTAIDAAKQNFAHSPWPARLSALHTDVLAFTPSQQFQRIICNPPYFNSGEQSRQSQRATARHTDSLRHDALLKRCYQLLEEDGKASFVLPITEGEQFIDLALHQGWHLSRLCRVQPSERKPVHRLLFELAKQPCATHESLLIIHSVDGYSDDFIQLTHEFYLKM
ncbi:Specifically methylates the adenine in position 37 of tRNA(1)(Val) (anticodon cmo5UAC) [Vibrio sp. B1FLJ16]|uniref:tRNA1(Val) (adenine(37)-N6)-methyltransferase n=1 Tax=Vibrio sp. B1FLJ16 TaxID=2751178 RepID=UPI0015F382D9|nr:methyltransferase [Vibrio sp. B1FLJ16]CAD7799403.1 Specifically methylates the adenine in position 37 of tRNA(1)(Val) (anticodon cmo5UAC) [Vibrio sp. B1FLJ16]CAE6885124.1 Specifically methylates the adenine in position 37 of tRNA(1)(Val) (anticodon cmo5UAC) [Vibrio sp. B1FLJ16]